jgi:hypothetical protein
MAYVRIVGRCENQGAMSYLERAGLLPTYRNPSPRIEPRALRVHSVPLARPHPAPEFQAFLRDDGPPQGGVTREWPYPGGDR